MSRLLLTHVEYRAMKEFVKTLLAIPRAATPSECQGLGFDYDAVSSLFSQMSVRLLKQEAKRGVDGAFIDALHRRLRQRGGEAAAEAEGHICLEDLCRQYRIGGYKVAKTTIELLLGRGQSVANVLEYPSLIEDATLREELLACIAMDPFCAHHLEQLKECMGREYEELLIAKLSAKRMCFETEAELRSKGKPKTPDILFLIPMATMHCNHPAKGLVVINWIDSKAMFADQETLSEHLEQLRGYSNRYGRGLVIYWHGFVEEIEASDDFIIANTLPEEWFFPGTGEIADGRVPSFDTDER